MPQSLSKVYVHITFSTKYRQPVIDDAIKSSLFEYIGGVCKGLECNPVRIGGYHDHVHVLCMLSRKVTQMKLVEEIKKQSSKWIKTKSPKYSNFYWQNGYGIFSVKSPDVDIVVNYIKNQQEHHSKASFQDEYRSLLKKNKLDFDERYVWD